MSEEPIHLAPWDDVWPRLLEAERLQRQSVLRPRLDGPIEHIGSTAVPGLMAKPVIDIMAGVRDLPSSLCSFATISARRPARRRSTPH